jgi:very-short-patch-repair endonuclease
MRKPKTDPVKMLDDFIMAAGGARKVRFDKSRCYFKWAIPAMKLGIEMDSGFIARVKSDKYNRAAACGWHIMRFTAHEIRCGRAFELLNQFINYKINKWKK